MKKILINAIFFQILISIQRWQWKSLSTQNSNSEEPLGVAIDTNLNFNEHVSNPYKKPSMKIVTLATITPKIFETNSSFHVK